MDASRWTFHIGASLRRGLISRQDTRWCDHRGVRAYVGVTDGDWYRYLAARAADEVNFWRPGGGDTFRALAIGEPFFFKSHYQDGNRVVGGGFYSGFAALRLSEAWQFFGEANGGSERRRDAAANRQVQEVAARAGRGPRDRLRLRARCGVLRPRA